MTTIQSRRDGLSVRFLNSERNLTRARTGGHVGALTLLFMVRENHARGALGCRGALSPLLPLL